MPDREGGAKASARVQAACRGVRRRLALPAAAKVLAPAIRRQLDAETRVFHRVHEVDTFLQEQEFTTCEYCKEGWFGTTRTAWPCRQLVLEWPAVRAADPGPGQRYEDRRCPKDPARKQRVRGGPHRTADRGRRIVGAAARSAYVRRLRGPGEPREPGSIRRLSRGRRVGRLADDCCRAAGGHQLGLQLVCHVAEFMECSVARCAASFLTRSSTP